MVSRKLDIPLLPQSTLLHLRAEGVDLRVGGGCRILEDVRHRSPAERVDDAVDHRSHRLAIRPTLLQPVKDLLFTRLPDCNQVLVDQPVQGRRYSRVRNLSRFEDLVVNCPRRRGAEIPNGPEDREFQLSKFQADYYMHSNHITTCRLLDSSQARDAAWVAVSENGYARMSNAATRAALVPSAPARARVQGQLQACPADLRPPRQLYVGLDEQAGRQFHDAGSDALVAPARAGALRAMRWPVAPPAASRHSHKASAVAAHPPVAAA